MRVIRAYSSTLADITSRRATKFARRVRYPLRRLIAFYTTLCLIFTGIDHVEMPAQKVAVQSLGTTQPLDPAARQPL